MILMDERTQYFINSVDAVRKKDTRLTDRIIGRLLNRNINYIVNLRHGREEIDDKTNDMWMNQIRPELYERFKRYEKINDSDLLQECRLIWKKHRQKVLDVLQITPRTVNSILNKKKRKYLLNIYDVGHNIPIYPKGNQKSVDNPIIVKKIQGHILELKQYGVFSTHIQKLIKKPNLFNNIGEIGIKKLTRQRALKLQQLDKQLIAMLKIAKSVDDDWSTLRNARKQYRIQKNEEQNYLEKIKKNTSYLNGSGNEKRATKNQKGMIILILWMRSLSE